MPTSSCATRGMALLLPGMHCGFGQSHQNPILALLPSQPPCSSSEQALPAHSTTSLPVVGLAKLYSLKPFICLPLGEWYKDPA